jgi:hypothetical protein
MRTIKLRSRRSDRRVGGKSTRLYIQPPLEVGDQIQDRDGFVYRLIGEYAGKPTRPMLAQLYESTRKDYLPRVLIWEYDCVACGARWQIRRGASYRPTARTCKACKSDYTGHRRPQTGEGNENG